MLSSAADHYRKQQRLTALAVREGRRRSTRGSLDVARAVASYQLASAMLTFESTPAELVEQGLRAPAVAEPVPLAVVTSSAAVVQMLDKVENQVGLDRLVSTLVNDAGRTAATVDLGRRPALTGHVRSLNLPSCSRCAILAGRVYRYSTGFQRHPGCDCLMTPTTEAAGRDLVLDELQAIKDGQITGLSRADMEALDAGADLGQVVNVRRRAAGLTEGSSVISRGGRLTPAGVMRLASDRAQVVDLLRQHRYLR